MNIDLHVHSRERSFCGRSTAEEQIQAAIAAGLDAIGFADHDQLFPQDLLQILNQKYAPFRIFGGIEMSVIGGEHILVFGVHDKALEKRWWDYPELHTFIREHDGFMALNHPFRFNPEIGIDYEQFPPDALEAYSNNISSYLQPRILKLAGQLGIKVLSNSDAHHAVNVGQYYNILEDVPTDERELVQLLKTGQFTCVFSEASYY